jgi:hypothetical protein
MPSYCHYTFAGLTVFTMAFTGCGPTDEQCPRPVGDYYGSYGIVAGNCTRITGRPLTFGADDPVNASYMRTSPSGPERTVLNRVGCTIEVKQDVTDMSGTSTLQGELSVNGTALQGVLSYSELLPDGKTERCRGRVDAEYALPDGVVIGAAAQAALMSP